MPDVPEPSPLLRAGSRALEGEVAGDTTPAWSEIDGAWRFQVRITMEAAPTEWVPQATSWWIVVDRRYPAGRLDFYPSKEGGLEATFPHQLYNADEDPDRPWRSGKLCLRADISSVKQAGYDVEPMEASRRLVWNVRRARHWLECAARDILIQEGDPFELPDLRAHREPSIVFFETAERLEFWLISDARSGFVTVRKLRSGCHKILVTKFEDIEGEAVAPEIELGPFLGEVTEESELGVWIRLDQVPVLPPWQAPQSWSELEAVARSQGIDLMSEIQLLVERRLRQSGRLRAEWPRHPLLLGFPIPKEHGGKPVRMHWIGFQMPALSGSKDTVNGYRPGNKVGRLMRDKRIFRRQLSSHIPWLPSENWSDEELTGRGRLPLSEHRVLLVGCGALGSQVAELLVRGGLRSLALVDGDFLEAGNLVRHTLDLADIGKNKATALAERLQRLSPHVRVEALPSKLDGVPESRAHALTATDLVIDCTADNGVLFELEELESEKPRTFVSMSTGPDARRLYLFLSRGTSFPRQQYVNAIEPRIEEDWEGVDSAKFPREGIGCWHPLMPATHLDLTLQAATAVKLLVERLEDDLVPPRFLVVGPGERNHEKCLLRVVHEEVVE